MSTQCYAKSALNESHLDVKMRIGCDGIEVQLLSELLSAQPGVNVIQHLHLKDFLKYPIRVIHSPLVKGTLDILLEESICSSGLKLLKQLFELTDYFGENYGMQIPLILHSETYLSKLKNVNKAYDRLVYELNDLLHLYPMTQLLIENIVPMRNMQVGGTVRFCNNVAFDNVVIVKALRDDLHTDRIGLVLDTCHQMITYNIVSHLYRFLDVTEASIEDLTMSRYLEQYAPYLKLMHICDMKDSGYGTGRHGIAFTQDTYSKLAAILNIKEMYAPNCPITLEVAETDYLVCDQYKQTKELVERYYGREIRYGS